MLARRARTKEVCLERSLFLFLGEKSVHTAWDPHPGTVFALAARFMHFGTRGRAG
jgi:hypothetical protein